MDHSPRFWDVVRSVVPDYEELRGSLKQDVLPVFD
jgi:predicted metal-dependent hydrolase